MPAAMRGCALSLVVAALLCELVPLALAPKDAPSASILQQLQGRQSQGAGVANGAASALLAGAAAALATIATARMVVPATVGGASTNPQRCAKPGMPNSIFCGRCSSSEDSDSDMESASECSGDDVGVDATSYATPSVTNPLAGKLWTKVQFPEGTDGPSNWDLANLAAAQEWDCPCVDCRNCIGSERIPLLHLYEYRKKFRTTAKSSGGFRDAARSEMEVRYDASQNIFMRSFKVGEVVDCCAASAGLAKGLSFGTFASARADVTKKRPKSEGRRVRGRTEAAISGAGAPECIHTRLAWGLGGAEGGLAGARQVVRCEAVHEAEVGGIYQGEAAQKIARDWVTGAVHEAVEGAQRDS